MKTNQKRIMASVFLTLGGMLAGNAVADNQQTIQPLIISRTVPLTDLTNVNRIWAAGTWTQGTNGLRVMLVAETNKYSPLLFVCIGSLTTNLIFVEEPNCKFARFELRNAKGELVPTVKGKSLEGSIADRLPRTSFPMHHNGLLHAHGFRAGSQPDQLPSLRLRDFFEINGDGDYTVTVCPAIYRIEEDGKMLSRIALPTVSMSIHLEKDQ